MILCAHCGHTKHVHYRRGCSPDGHGGHACSCKGFSEREPAQVIGLVGVLYQQAASSTEGRILHFGDKPIVAHIAGVTFACSAAGTVEVVAPGISAQVTCEEIRQFESALAGVMLETEKWRDRLRGAHLPTAVVTEGVPTLSVKRSRYQLASSWPMRLSEFRGTKSWRVGTSRYYPKHFRGRPPGIPADAVAYTEWPKCTFCSSPMERGWVEAKHEPWSDHAPKTCEKCMQEAIVRGRGGIRVVGEPKQATERKPT